jgi:hypothetical protein
LDGAIPRRFYRPRPNVKQRQAAQDKQADEPNCYGGLLTNKPKEPGTRLLAGIQLDDAQLSISLWLLCLGMMIASDYFTQSCRR